MFAYCLNNPVNMVDSCGNWPQWIEDAAEWVTGNVINPIISFINDIAEDANDYDPNNQSEAKVFSSHYFSNYKGVLVIHTPLDTSFSFGIIGLSYRQKNVDSLRHEYGHTLQLKDKGMPQYIFDVAIPSVTINILSRQNKLPFDYYSYPFEAEANALGQSTLSDTSKPPLPAGAYSSYWDLIKLFL